MIPVAVEDSVDGGKECFRIVNLNQMWTKAFSQEGLSGFGHGCAKEIGGVHPPHAVVEVPRLGT